jgi:CTP:molybdopterin cytidylyltransferase MocA
LLAIMVAELIVLAGGRSSRMGEPKGLLAFGGRPWLELQLGAFARAGGSRATLVFGHDVERYEAALGWATRAIEGEVALGSLAVSAVVNPEPERGSFSSLLCGVRALVAHHSERAFLLPVDVPAPSRNVWIALAEQLGDAVFAAVPTFEGRGGHPVLLAGTFLARLLDVPLDAEHARLDHQLRALAPHELARVAVNDPRVVMNINTPADVAALNQAIEGGIGGK